MSRARLLCALLFAACTQPLELPAPPGEAAVPVLTAFTPAAAFADDALSLTLGNTDAGTAGLVVEFAGGATAPVEAGADGLVVHVPPLAESGPLVLVSARARTTSDAAFTMLGHGRLRERRLSTIYQGSVGPLDLAPLAGGAQIAFAIDAPPQIALFHEGDLTFFRDLGGVHPALLRTGGDGRTLVTLGAMDAADGCPGPVPEGRQRLGYAVLHLDSVVPATLTRTAAGCVGDFPGEASWTLAVDEGATRAVVIAGSVEGRAIGRAVSVELSSGVVTDLPALSEHNLQDVVLVPGIGFVVIDGAGLRLIPLADPTTVVEAAASLPGIPEDDQAVVLGAHRSGLLAVGSRGGRVAVFDATQWPPVAVAIVNPSLTVRGAASDVTNLEFTTDGRGLAIGQQALGIVRLVHLPDPGVAGEEVVPVASIPAPIPSTLRALPSGTMLISARNSVLVVSQATGAFIDEVPLVRRQSHPAFTVAPAPCEAVTALATVSQGLGFVDLRLPQSLSRMECEIPLEMPPEGTRGGVTELVAASRARWMFAAFDGGGLARQDPEGKVVAWPGLQLPRGRGDDPFQRALDVSPDGRTLVVADAKNARILAFDGQAADFATRAPLELETGTDAVRALADETRIVVAGAREVRVYDAALARSGTIERKRTFPVDEGVSLAALGRDRLFILTETGRALAMSLADGALAELDAVPSGLEMVDMVAAPSGREAYVLLRADADGGYLWIASPDHRDSTLLPITSQDGALWTGLAVSPDGERVVTVDARWNLLAGFR